MRRRAVAAVAVLSVALAACSGSGPDAAADGSGASGGPAAPADATTGGSAPAGPGAADPELAADAMVGQGTGQTWRFTGPDARWEGVFRVPAFPVTRSLDRWFADAEGGVVVARRTYDPGASSGLDRLAPNGVVTPVVPARDDRFADLVGVGRIAGRAVAVLAQLPIGDGPDAWRIVAHDVLDGTEVLASTGEVGRSVDVRVTAAAVADDAVAWATAPNRRDEPGPVRVAVEVGGTVTEVLTAEDRTVASLAFGPGPSGTRLYVVTAPRVLAGDLTGAAFRLLAYDGTTLVLDEPFPAGWGRVDDDWFHVPARLSTNGRDLLLAGRPTPADREQLVDLATAPPVPVWRFSPADTAWTRLELTGDWSYRNHLG